MSTTHMDGPKTSDEDKHECEWEGCQGNPHPEKIVYENKKNGCTERGKYVGNWPKPFHIPTPSYLNYGVKEGEYKGLNSTKYDISMGRSDCNDYKTEFHHVIPVDVMDGKSALKKNLKLIGWNINDGMSNGICLPYFKEDTIWHDLQPHRGSHPGDYIASVNELIGPLNTICKKYCLESEDKKSKKDQATLLTKILEDVETIRNRILNWEAHVHLEETLDNWSDQIVGRRTYYKSKNSKPSAPPMMYKGKRTGSRKYLEI